jgi:uncharacterized protein
MQPIRLVRLFFALLVLAPLAACGDDAQSAAVETQPAAQEDALAPWERIPPDSLYGATAAENIRFTRVEIDVLDLPPGWDGMEIAVISDLQLGLWEENERVAAAAVQRAVSANADLIVLLGDFLAVGRDSEALARALQPLRGQRALAVLGDRDVRNDSVEARVRQTLEGAGVTLLVNSTAAFERNGDTAWIAGIAPDLVTRSIADQEFLVATTGGPITPLLLAHNPMVAARAPQGRRPAIIAGNTFCGRVEVPGTPRLSWYEEQAMPNLAIPEVERLYRIRNNTLFITCGIGYSFLPVRLGAPPEVALVTLRGIGVRTADPQPDPGAAALDTLMQQYGVEPDTT